MKRKGAVFTLLLAAAHAASADTIRFKQACLRDLVAQIPGILATEDPKTGHFGKGIWVVTDQNVLLPLAGAWSYRDGANPYYHNRELLDAIMAAGDALIDAQDGVGKWIFRKKDDSVWGKIYMPWTYSRWIRAFALIRGAMPAARRVRWEKALRLGFAGIAREMPPTDIKNIPAQQAAALFIAGTVLDEPAWCGLAAGYIHKVVAAQNPDGYWSEHSGPVVRYGFVYVDALGIYLAASKDESVRPALRRAAVFHTYFTYPDGSPVETVDERTPYAPGIEFPNVGFTLSAEGRGYLARQQSLLNGRIPADAAASLLLIGEEGQAISPPSADFDYVLPSGNAMVRRRGPWFLVASAFTAPLSQIRWIQDRQNFVSVYRDGLGVLVGGGNTKLQPRWSNFTIGNVNAWFHKPGDEKPNFFPPPDLMHIPSSAALLRGADFGVELDYGANRGRIVLRILGPGKMECEYRSDPALTGHVVVIAHPREPLVLATGRTVLTEKSVDTNPGRWVEHSGLRMRLPAGARLRWPVRPHDPYRKDGSATLVQSRIVIDLPPGGAHAIMLECVRCSNAKTKRRL